MASAHASTSSIPLCTGPAADAEGGLAYRLLELPGDVAELIEAAVEERRRKGAAERANDNVSASRKRKASGEDPLERGEEGAPVSRLVINGRHNDEAVLCTASRTYALREVSQSNSLLLCSIDSDTAGSRDAQSTPTQSSRASKLRLRSNVSSLLELAPVVPRLERISSLLKASMYAGDTEEKAKHGERRYTPTEVRSVVQASDQELQKGYDARRVVLLDGHMRLVCPQLLKTLLRSLVLVIDAESYPIDAVPLRSTLAALEQDHSQDVRYEVLLALLTRWFGSRDEDDDSVVRLNGSQIVAFLGLQLLKEGAQATKGKSTKALPYGAFLQQWASLLGDDAAEWKTLDLRLLSGQYLINPPPTEAASNATKIGNKSTTKTSHGSATPLSAPVTIEYFPAELLPIEPAPRFQELFSTRRNWLMADLEPFIVDLAVDPKRREALMLRFARAKKTKVVAPVVKGRVAASEVLGASKQSEEGGVGISGELANRADVGEGTLYSARVKY